MFQNYNSYLSSRQKSLFAKLRKAQTRLQSKIDNGSFAKMTRQKRWQLLSRLRRYALQLQRVGISLRTLTTGTALALALGLTNPVTAQPFTEQTGGNNPFNGLITDNAPMPSFVDVDNDGDMDAFIGEVFGTINYYQNTGTASSPAFTQQTGGNNPLNGEDVGYYAAPSFVDVDGDGDMDAFVGEREGTIRYYQNTGTASSPVFTQQSGGNNPLIGVDVGKYSAPSFVDVDGDGDMDAFIGELYGTIKYYQNTGTASSPTFTQQTGSNNPLNGVGAGYYFSTPSFVDFDGDGDMDVFIGESNGTINYYQNTGTASSPTFTQQTGGNNPLNGIDVGYFARPDLVDVDDDGDMDVFIGENYAILNYYQNMAPVLPVELISFRARLEDQQAYLIWNTATETNNQGFEIQRAVGSELGSEQWKSIGYVNGAINSLEERAYQFIDVSPEQGANYYRLKQMDYDGAFEYSPVVIVNLLNLEGLVNLRISPNPIQNGSFNLSFLGDDFESGELSIFDSMGRLVQSQTILNTNTEIQTGDFPKGIYMMNLEVNGQRFLERIVVNE